jgi:hypothetical protein
MPDLIKIFSVLQEIKHTEISILTASLNNTLQNAEKSDTISLSGFNSLLCVKNTYTYLVGA